jgi:CAAX protease family protein
MDASPREHATLLQERWGPWATVAWGAGAALVLVASQTLGAIAFLAWRRVSFPGVPLDAASLGTNGPLLATVFLISTPLVVAYFVLAVRLARVPFGEYMALNRPTWRDILIGIGALAAVLVVAGAGATLSGQETPEFMTESFRTARDAGILPLFIFSLAVLAPVQEELFFRGFLYRGLSTSIGPWPTIVLTSAVWSVVHLQYEWFFIGEIFVLGLAFGWLRLRSGSTILTMILHGGMNTLAIVTVGFESP